MTKRFINFLQLLIILLAANAQASTLSTTAGGLSPGGFAVIVPTQSAGTQDNYPTVWGDSGGWWQGPAIGQGKFFYVGQGDDSHVGYHFIIYDEATNTFNEGPDLPGLSPKTCSIFNHGYDLNTIDPTTGNFYRALHRGDAGGWSTCPGPFSDVYRYSPTSNTWARLPNNTGEPNVGPGSYTPEAIAWWPEKNGFIWIYPPTNHIWLFSETTQAWSLFASFDLQAAISDSIAEYDYVNHRMVVGTSNMMHILNADGTHSQIGALPTAGGVYYSGNGIKGNIVSRPVSGQFMFLKEAPNFPHNHDWYTWNAQTNAQSGPLAGVPAPNPVYGAVSSAPNSTYGLVMTLACYTSCRLLIYKDGNVVQDTTPPTQPQNVVATVVSSSQINLTWNASTDTGGSGVNHYDVSRCSGNGCSNFAGIATPVSNSYNDTGLSASTFYTYCVRATDNAGNPSAFNCAAQVQTQAGSGGITPEQDFANRCNAPGVVKCWGFDNAATDMVLGTQIFAGQSPGGTTPSQDSVIKTSGSSIKFFLPASALNTPCGSGGCKPDIGGRWEPQGNVLGAFNGTSFGPGSTFYTQFRMRVSSSHITNTYQTENGGIGSTAWKFYELLYNASQFGNFGLVWGTKPNGGTTIAPAGYMGASAIIIGSYSDIGGSSPTEFCLGNGYQPYCLNPGDSGADPRSPYYSIQQKEDGTKCDYGEWFSGGHPDCFYIAGDTWYTFKFKVTYGTAHGFDSRIEGWYALEGATQWTRFLNTLPTFPLAGVPTNPMNGTVLNTANFSTYMTNLNSCVTPCADAAMWIDEFIISTADIAIPGGSAASVPASSVRLTRRGS